MKKIYLLLILNVMTFDIWSQVAWAKKGGLWAYDYGYGVVTDVNNNVYVAGKFEMNAIYNHFLQDLYFYKILLYLK